MVVSGLVQVYFFLVCAGVTLAALQNVTVDDYYPTDSSFVVYLPNSSLWNQGNDCSECLVRPDPSQAYDGTWHDTTYHSYQTVVQGFNFTFTGNGLYIFFILANYVPNSAITVTTLTNVSFILDGVQVSTFTHNPSTSTNYLYNQSVYANNSIPYGEHTMNVVPVDQGTNLLLFDYLIYTTDPDASSTTSVLTTSSSTAISITTTSVTVQSSSSSISPSVSSSTTPAKENVASVIGGAIGGTGALVAVVLCLLFCRRYKKGTSERSFPTDRNMVEPFGIPISSEDAPLRSRQTLTGFISSKGRMAAVAPTIVQPEADPSAFATTSSPTGPSTYSSNSNTEVLQQVRLLRDEVTRLRYLQSQRDTAVPSLPPPEYGSM